MIRATTTSPCYILLAAVVCPLCTGSTSWSADADAVNERLIHATRSFVVTTMQEQNVPGCNIALARGGEIIWEEGFGFSEYVQRHVMDPLGMTSTQYPPVQDADHVRPDIFRNMSVGYTVMGKLRYRTTRQYFADYPAGTFVGTPGDHIRLLLAMANGGEYDGTPRPLYSFSASSLGWT
jgi:CubicO group peptidase (beta-lactamase class C family)